MEIEFDPPKDAINREKHGLSLGEFRGFDDDGYRVIDDRFDYGEVRMRALGRIGGVPHMIVYVQTPAGVRLISFRRVHEKEMRRHGQGTTPSGL